MNRDHLQKTASKLKQPSNKTCDEYITKTELMAADLNRIMTSRADVLKMVGTENLSMMEDNHRNHARFMCSVFTDYEPDVLIETVIWVFRAYRQHGFNLTYWPAQLDQWVIILKENLTEEAYKEIYPFYDWMIVNQPVFVAESDKMIS